MSRDHAGAGERFRSSACPRSAGALAGARLMARVPGLVWLAVHNCHGHALRTSDAVAALR